MELPFGTSFLKKVRLYNLIKRLNKQTEDIDKHLLKNKKSKIPSSWPIEKNILKWSLFGHKHLGSPISYDNFNINSIHCKLKDWRLCENNFDEKPCILEEKYKLILKYQKPKKIFENMVMKGFADHYNKINVAEGIILREKGLLIGEVIYDTDKKLHLIYRIYNWLMNSGGAWILFLFVIFIIIITFANSVISLILNLLQSN